MKAFLMYSGRDFDTEQAPLWNEQDLVGDLELETLLEAMAADDKFLLGVARRAVLASMDDPGDITYRQRVFADCLENPAVITELYNTAVAAIAGERDVYFGLFRDSPEVILNRSVRVLAMFEEMLRKLRGIADEHAGKFSSPGFSRFFAMLQSELSDDYLAVIGEHLRELRFRRGLLISAGLGKGSKGIGYVLRRQREQGWRDRIPGAELIPGAGRAGYSFLVADRDEAGARALSDLRSRGLNDAASALGQSSDHILSFFVMLRRELGFYIGCLNLHGRLTGKGEPVCFPVPVPVPVPARPGEEAFVTEGLYDPCLTLSVDATVVGNDVAADGRRLVMVTGANQGGKSTFLRSVGVAQLMMQCGMFVPARSFRASVRRGLCTHFKREEDASMRSGKLDEELARMSGVAERVRAGWMLLCNESFASTNEREGSEIARQIVRALVESGVMVVFVTHLFDLADGFFREGSAAALFLRAQRESDGRRTFRLAEGEPLPTSYGEDLYLRIFGVQAGAGQAGAGHAGAGQAGTGQALPVRP